MTIYLFIYLCLLFAGGLVLLLLTFSGYKRTRDPLLLSYAYYLLAVSATAFESRIAEAFFALIAKTRNLPPAAVETTTKTLCLLSVPLLFLCWYLFLRLMARLAGRRIGRAVWLGYLAAQSLAAAAFAVMIANFFSGFSAASSGVFSTAFAAVIGTGAFIRLWALAQVVFDPGSPEDAARRKSLLRFAGIYAAVLTAYYGARLIPHSGSIIAIVSPLIAVFVEYAPLVYPLAMARQASSALSALPLEEDALNRLADARGLTPREREILGLLLAGRDNREIHKVLFISPGTVRNYVSSIYRKLGLKNRYQLLVWARQGGNPAGNEESLHDQSSGGSRS